MIVFLSEKSNKPGTDLLDHFGLSAQQTTKPTPTVWFHLNKNNNASTSSNSVKIDYDTMTDTELPYETMVHIFSFLQNASEIVKCSQVCKLWNLASKNDALWKDIIINKGIGTFYG